MKAAKKQMTRAEAQAMYEDLKKAMAQKLPDLAASLPKDKNSKPSAADSKMAREIAQSIKSALSKEPRAGAAIPRPAARMTTSAPTAARNRGPIAALSMVVLCAFFKVTLTVLEVSGVLGVEPAQAALDRTAPQSMAAHISSNAGFSKDDVRLLTSLDSRRVELDERGKKLDLRERDLEKRDGEFAAKITELRELTDKLKNQRDKDEKRRSTQYEQLANVYGSMEPKEAASLIEQLDVMIALQLLQRMPEKRIGQILSLMSPDKALAITKLLGGIANRG